MYFGGLPVHLGMNIAITKQGLRVGLLTLLLAAPALAQAQGPSFEWAVTCGVGSQPTAGASPVRLVVDAQGNTYVAGSFAGTVTIGSFTLTSLGSGDVFVAKLDPQGNYLWVTTAGGTGGDGANCIALDGAGGVYVGGGFGSYSIGFGPGNIRLYNSSADTEVFVVKLDASAGQWAWAQRAGGTGSDAARAIAVTGQGEVCLAGEFSSGAASFGPTTLACSPVTSGGYRRDVFVAKLAGGGAWLWAVRGGGVQTGETVSNLVVDAAGFLYLAGTVNGSVPFTAQFGSSTLVGNYTSGGIVGANDGYVARLDTNGTWLWAVQGDAAGLNKLTLKDMAADRQGYLYVGGEYEGLTAHIGTAVLPNLGQLYPPLNPAPPFPINRYHSSAFVARLDAATGAWGWAVRAGGPDGSEVDHVVADAQGRVYVSGSFDKVLPVSPTEAKAAQLDGATGDWRWAGWGSSVIGIADGLAVDNYNHLYISTYFYGTPATFGTITLNGPGANYYTGVVARLGLGVLATTAPAAAVLQVWPSPSSGSRQVQVAGAAPGAVVQVLDVLGRQVWAARMPATRPMALPADLPAGVYLVRSAGQYQRLIVE